MNILQKIQRRISRKRRTNASAKVSGKARLIVYRSNKSLYAQIVNDADGKVVCGTSGLKLKSTGIKAATEVGKAIADMAKKNKVSEVAFDRNGYKYHGQIKALADGAREAGLKF